VKLQTYNYTIYVSDI